MFNFSYCYVYCGNKVSIKCVVFFIICNGYIKISKNSVTISNNKGNFCHVIFNICST